MPSKATLLAVLAAATVMLVVWFRNPPGWVEVLWLIAMAAAVALVALVMASMWH